MSFQDLLELQGKHRLCAGVVYQVQKKRVGCQVLEKIDSDYEVHTLDLAETEL